MLIEYTDRKSFSFGTIELIILYYSFEILQYDILKY